MQPNFTLKKLGFVSIRFFAIALIIGLTTQFSFSQQRQSWDPLVSPQRVVNKNGEIAKPKVISNQIVVPANQSLISDNDAGLPNRPSNKPTVNVNRPEAICATFTGSLLAGDLTMAQRLNRPGLTTNNCGTPTPWTFPGTFGTGPYFYDVYSYTNNTGLTQCGTFTLTSTDVVNANLQFGLWNTTFNPASLATNYIADPGGSTATPPVALTIQVTIPAGQVLAIAVWSTNDNSTAAGTASNYTLTIDFPICATVPCTGTPAPGNTIASANPVGPGSPFTLSIQNAIAGAGVVHTWQSSPTGAAPWTNLVSGPANTYATSQVAQTYYRDSVYCTGSTLSGISTPILVTMSACGWSNSTVVPVPIMDAPSVTIGSNLYTFGGVSNNAVIATSYKFDGTTWTTNAPVPAALEFSSACTDGTSAFILGGAITGTGVPQTTMYKYNPTSNTYTTLAPFTIGTWNHASVVLNCKIYKIAGTTATVSTAAVEIYDIASGTWSLGAPLPAATSFPSAFVDGGYIYVVGGLDAGSSVPTTKTYRYDPGTNTWNDAAIADLPVSRWGAAGDAYNGKGIVAGGYVGGVAVANTSTSVISWNSISNAWTTELPMSSERARMTGAVLNNAFYVIGGRSIASSGFIGENSNQRFACTVPVCAGTPNPGNTVGPCTLPCTGESFTLRLQNNPAVSGLTYQWQISTAGVAGPYANISGANSSTFTTTISGTTWFRATVTCGASSAISTPLMIVSGQGVFNTQPANATIVCGGNTSFTVAATGTGLTWQWEQRTGPAAPWTLVTNTGIYSGATTSTLTLSNVSQSFNGYQYRAIMQGTCTAPDFSNAATLTVNAIVAVVNPTSATICLGTVQQLSLTNTVSAPNTIVVANNTPLPIPDGTPAGVYSTIAIAGIPAGSVITDISVKANITHGWVGDLEINLIAPNGVSMNLIGELNGGTGSNSTANFVNTVISSNGTTALSGAPAPRTGTFAADRLNGFGPTGNPQTQPDGMPWSALQTVMNGNWQLGLSDWFTPDAGTLNNWSLSITYVAPNFAQGTWTGPAGTMFTDLAATIPYTGTPATTIYVKPTVTSNYQVSFTTATPCTSTTATVPVTVITPVTGVANPTNTSACLGTTATFTSATATGGPFVRQWQVSTNSGLTWTNITGATSATLTLTNVTQIMNNNLYRVNYTAAPCVGTVSSNSAKLTVNPLPVVTISAPDLALTPGQTTVITGTSSPAAISWTWTRDGAAIAGTTNSQTVNIDKLGAYQATVIDNQTPGCTAKSNILVIGSESSDRLWIYPNPTTGAFQARLYFQSDFSEKRIVTIYNSLGQEITSKRFNLLNITAPYLQMDFDLTNMPRGTYVVKVAHEFTGKIVSGLVLVQ